MAQTLRVSLPTYNALIDNDPRHYSIFADSDNILIKEHSRGSGSISDGAVVTIAHNLGYVPFVLVMAQQTGQPIALCSAGESAAGTLVRCDVDSTNLYIRDVSNGTGGSYQYYIFYDQQV